MIVICYLLIDCALLPEKFPPFAARAERASVGGEISGGLECAYFNCFHFILFYFLTITDTYERKNKYQNVIMNRWTRQKKQNKDMYQGKINCYL